MQSRRWWYSVALTLVAVSTSSTFGRNEPQITQASLPPVTDAFINELVKDFKKGGVDAARAADRLLDVVSSQTNKGTPQWLDKTFAQIATQFDTQILSAPVATAPAPATAPAAPPTTGPTTGAATAPALPVGPPVYIATPQSAQVQAIVALVQAQNEMLSGANPVITIDGVLRKQLGHTNAAIRYWTAKGLANIVAVSTGGGLRPKAKKDAMDDLAAALKKESIPVVQVQLIRALIAGGDLKSAIAGVDASAMRLKLGPPSSTEIDCLLAEIGDLTDAVKGNPAPALITDAVSAGAKIANFMAQHAAVLELRGDASAKNFTASAITIANATLKLFNTAIAKTPAPFPAAVKATNAVDLFVEVESYTKGPASIQKYFPNAATPPRLDDATPAAPTTSAPVAVPVPTTTAAGK